MPPLTPDEALARLREGHQRFLADERHAPGRDAERRAMLAESQEPFCAILCCADSRVAPEIVFDAGLGELFVIRVAGNVANKATVASIEFAISALGVRLVVVMAHGNCGAVAAAIEGGHPSDSLRYLLDFIQPAVDAAHGAETDDVARRNAALTAERLQAESPIIREAVAGGGVRIATGFYQPGSGHVDLAEVSA